MCAASFTAHALVVALVAACSGSTTTIIDQPGDAGGSDAGTHGGVDATGGDGPVVVGSDASESGTVHVDAAGHETGAACTPSPPNGSACNSLTVPPATVPIVCNPTEQVPAPTGGTIRDGLYVMTSSTFYAGGSTCPATETDGVTWFVCGSSWQLAQSTALSGQAPQNLVANATVAPSGTSVSITLTCGLTINPVDFGYDATATTLRLHIDGSSSNGRIDTFTRQ